MTSYTHVQQACTSPLSTVQTKLGQSTHLQTRYTFVFRITERTCIVMSGLRGKRGDRYIAGLRPKWLSRFECFRRDSCERPISCLESAGVLRAGVLFVRETGVGIEYPHTVLCGLRHAVSCTLQNTRTNRTLSSLCSLLHGVLPRAGESRTKNTHTILHLRKPQQ